MVFLDWLSVYQDHKPGSLPVLGADWVLTSPIDVEGVYEFDEVEGSEGSAFVHFVDFQTGEVVERPVSWKSVRAYQHPGSFDTKLRIRCDGSRVTVSGNPSAFCRMDNLFGFTEVSQAVDFYNVILQSLGMPSFVDMRSDLDSGHLVFDDHGRHVSDGRFFAHSDTICEYGRPIITAIHITENINIPMIPFRYKGKTVFPVGNLRGVWTHEILKYAIECGCEIKEIFKQYIYTQKSC